MTSDSRTFAIGIDYGTSAVRALVVETHSGEEIATGVHPYACGDAGVIGDSADPNVARQDPREYTTGFLESVRIAIRAARAVPGFDPARVVGIGVDTTGSTPMPVAADGEPLAWKSEFRGNPSAMAWLWKDHTSFAEAAEITDRARREDRPYLARCGGTYSSEWYWSKVLRCERAAPKVAAAAASWVECCDFVPAWLTGRLDPFRLNRSVCAAGHKALYAAAWDGPPQADFLDRLAPGLSRHRRSFGQPCLPADRRAGGLSSPIASEVGLPAGIPVAVGAFDAHLGAVGAGIAPGTLVKIIGTSTCDILVAPLDVALPDIPGVCGIVPESVVSNAWGIEAGQSAVGDIFHWFVAKIAPAGFGTGDAAHAALSDAAGRLRPGESGLLALDWHNGNRTILVDPLLTGLIVGETLSTTPAEIYRALIEATAFGALRILERVEEYGVKVDRVVNCGGVAEKNPVLMQIYADVCNRPMVTSRSAQTCALGAAICGAIVGGAHADFAAAQRAMTGWKPRVHEPQAERVAVYRRLYALYRRVHDAFGVVGASGALHDVMKELISIRTEARRGHGGSS